MAGSAGSSHVGYLEALMCRTVLMEFRNEGMFVLCGFVGIGASWYVATGAWDSVQSADALSSKSREGMVLRTRRVAGCR